MQTYFFGYLYSSGESQKLCDDLKNDLIKGYFFDVKDYFAMNLKNSNARRFLNSYDDRPGFLRRAMKFIYMCIKNGMRLMVSESVKKSYV